MYVMLCMCVGSHVNERHTTRKGSVGFFPVLVYRHYIVIEHYFRNCSLTTNTHTFAPYCLLNTLCDFNDACVCMCGVCVRVGQIGYCSAFWQVRREVKSFLHTHTHTHSILASSDWTNRIRNTHFLSNDICLGLWEFVCNLRKKAPRAGQVWGDSA